MPVKFHSDRTILNTNLTASRLYEILRKDVFSDIETGPSLPAGQRLAPIWLCTSNLIFLRVVVTNSPQLIKVCDLNGCHGNPTKFWTLPYMVAIETQQSMLLNSIISSTSWNYIFLFIPVQSHRKAGKNLHLELNFYVRDLYVTAREQWDKKESVEVKSEIQSGAVVTQSILSWDYMRNCHNSGRKWIRF